MKLYQEANLSPELTGIVDVQFAFYNKALLKLLNKRANAIKKAKFDEVTKIER